MLFHIAASSLVIWGHWKSLFQDFYVPFYTIQCTPALFQNAFYEEEMQLIFYS